MNGPTKCAVCGALILGIGSQSHVECGRDDVCQVVLAKHDDIETQKPTWPQQAAQAAFAISTTGSVTPSTTFAFGFGGRSKTPL